MVNPKCMKLLSKDKSQTTGDNHLFSFIQATILLCGDNVFHPSLIQILRSGESEHTILVWYVY